ncbi:hypothetical protein TrLO_g2925 [Triparma laevis f. longispina]|uniref:PABS domain-containing protein n=1 Tax=Triparma laevis f. longispina TaxID=1714387 RepID=A0A9W7FHY9_9STRA|nr:hypothetical protein TrLO_g2925 [Triparma laevis f. longispina]
MTSSSDNNGCSSGWFTESSVLWPGQKSSLALEGLRPSSVLYSSQSEFQSILVFKSAQHGKVLCLDGVIQFTERDEYCYAEMMSNLPIMSHDNPYSADRPPSLLGLAQPSKITTQITVLIIGGGDGGVLREICRHSHIFKITLVEIDPTVITVTKKYFSHLDKGRPSVFDDPRLEIVHLDAADFLAEGEHLEEFDVIINDSSDPCGPSERLYSPAFFEEMYKSLKPNGIVCSQCESMWLNLDFACSMLSANASIFDNVQYANIMVPTYPSGSIGIICGRKADSNGNVGCCDRPGWRLGEEVSEELRYYSGKTHRSCFVLPKHIQRRMDKAVRGEEGGEGGYSYDDDDDEEEEEEEDYDDYNDGKGEGGVCVIS